MTVKVMRLPPKQVMSVMKSSLRNGNELFIF